MNCFCKNIALAQNKVTYTTLAQILSKSAKLCDFIGHEFIKYKQFPEFLFFENLRICYSLAIYFEK